MAKPAENPGNGGGNGNGNGGGAPAPNPGKGNAHANPGQARAAMAKMDIAFGKDYIRSDGTIFRIVTDAITDFDVVADSNDGDAMALFLENPVQLLMAQIFALHERVKALERGPNP